MLVQNNIQGTLQGVLEGHSSSNKNLFSNKSICLSPLSSLEMNRQKEGGGEEEGGAGGEGGRRRGAGSGRWVRKTDRTVRGVATYYKH